MVHSFKKENPHYKILYSQSAQQLVAAVAESFRAFKGTLDAYFKGKVSVRPKLPGYRKKGGLAGLTYPAQSLSVNLETGLIRLPLGNRFKCLFDLDAIYIPGATNIRFEQIRELRIIPRNGCFYIEYVYGVPKFNCALDQRRTLGIDPGLNNWVACVTNTGKCWIIDGKKLRFYRT